MSYKGPGRGLFQHFITVSRFQMDAFFSSLLLCELALVFPPFNLPPPKLLSLYSSLPTSSQKAQSRDSKRWYWVVKKAR